MAKNLLILTNNPKVIADFGKLNHQVCDTYEQVLLQTRDRIHTGSCLLMHPLAGSVKPGESPYRSVVIDHQDDFLDMRSLEIIEGAIDRFNTMTAVPRDRFYNEKTLADFQLIDFELLTSALTAIDPNLLRE